MKIIRGFKTELDLNDKQRTACLKHAGAARFAYNFALQRKEEARRAGKKVPTAMELHRELNRLKKTEHPRFLLRKNRGSTRCPSVRPRRRCATPIGFTTTTTAG